MKDDNVILELIDLKDYKNLHIGNVDFTNYLLSYSLKSNLDDREITLTLKIPPELVVVRHGAWGYERELEWTKYG